MSSKNPIIIHFPEVVSTNTYLRNLLQEKKLQEGTTVWADYQTGGRGQMGNVWESESGKNITFSMLLHPIFVGVKEQFILSQCVALAVKDVLLEYVSDIKIKWPNDIYWKNRKICGILIENQLHESSISQSIVGVGINVNQENFSCICQTPPTSLRIILDEEQNRERILQKVVSRILYYYHEAKNGNRIEVENKYKTKLFSTGKFQEKGVVFEATITDVEPDGTLVLKDSSGKIRRYLFKEVEFLIT